jgi:hypothetical protein
LRTLRTNKDPIEMQISISPPKTWESNSSLLRWVQIYGHRVTKVDVMMTNNIDADNALLNSSLSPLLALTNLESLHINVDEKLSSWHVADKLNTLRSLAKSLVNLAIYTDIEKYDFLSSLTKLIELDLCGVNATRDDAELRFCHIRGLNDLTMLNVTSRSYNDMKHISHLTNLQELNVTDCRCKLDFKTISNLPKLECLIMSDYDFGRADDEMDMKQLSHLKNLTYLDMSICKNIMSFVALSYLRRLKEINLEYSKTAADISPLSCLTNLQTLHIHECGITDVSKLTVLKSLKIVT